MKTAKKDLPAITREALNVPTAQLVAGINNLRAGITECPGFLDLVASIKENGVQVPLIVRAHPTAKEKFEVLAGCRRLAAAKASGLQMIPVNLVQPCNDKLAAEITILENAYRMDLAPIEQLAAAQLMMEKHADDIKAVAARLAISEPALRMRLKLQDLSPAWKKAIAVQEHIAAKLTVAHLGLVARLPAASQNDFLKEESHRFIGDQVNLLSVKRFEELINNYVNTLESAPWLKGPDQDSFTLVKAAGSCGDCQKRSCAEGQLGLWGEKPNTKTGDRCLDPECFQKKQVAFFERRQKELKAEIPGLKIVASKALDYQKSNFAQQNLEAVLEYQFGKVSEKEEKGSRPALMYGGPKNGQLVYVTEPEIPDWEKKKTKDNSLEAKRARLARQRAALAIAALQTAITNLKYDPKAQYCGEEKIISLAAVFGTYMKFDRYDDGSWIKMKAGPAAKLETLFGAVKGTMVNRLTCSLPASETPQELINEAETVAAWFDINYTKLLLDAEAAKPEPESWAVAAPAVKKVKAKK